MTIYVIHKFKLLCIFTVCVEDDEFYPESDQDCKIDICCLSLLDKECSGVRTKTDCHRVRIMCQHLPVVSVRYNYKAPVPCVLL